MIAVVDDFLTPSYIDSLYRLARNHLSYVYMPKTSWTEKNDDVYHADDVMVKDSGQLSCCVYEEGCNHPFSWAYEQMKPIFYTINDLYPQLKIVGSHRVKFNLLLQKDFGDHYNQPHVDVYPYYGISHTLLLYLHDTDGDTFLFDQMITDRTIPSALTVKQRVSPKRNRAVIFETNRMHASSNPSKNETRFVLNWILKNA